MRYPLIPLKKLSLAIAISALIQLPVYASGQTFKIDHFKIKGNALISSTELQSMVQPFTGEGRKYGDIQKALELIEANYRALGYGSVQVYVPEQDITSGEVIIDVTETEVEHIVTDDVDVFDRENLLHSLPSIKIGYSPNNYEMARNVALVNENPAKKVEAVMAMSEEEGKLDVKVKVKADNPFSVMFTGDNTGNASTGAFRVGSTVSYANLFNRDQVVSLSYITALTSDFDIRTDKVGRAIA